MVLALTHTKFEVYKVAGEIVLECYRLMAQLPNEEKFNLVQQIKRASLSIKLNIAEGASRKSIAERRRFYEIARSSLVELDAAIDVCIGLHFLKTEQLSHLGLKVNSCYAMLSKMTGK
jgi:four helix bundle protein